MAYVKTDWTTSTPINPTNLNKIESGIEEAQNKAESVTKDSIGLGNVDNVKQASKSEFDNHITDYDKFKITALASLNEYASVKANGCFEVVEYQRRDGTLYIRSELSNYEAGVGYKAISWYVYDETGTNQTDSISWRIYRDADGDIYQKNIFYHGTAEGEKLLTLMPITINDSLLSHKVI